MADKEDNDREVSLMVKEGLLGTTSELEELIPHIDLSPDIPDDKIKKAILDISRSGMESLFNQHGRENVLNFISTFAEGRDW